MKTKIENIMRYALLAIFGVLSFSLSAQISSTHMGITLEKTTKAQAVATLKAKGLIVENMDDGGIEAHKKNDADIAYGGAGWESIRVGFVHGKASDFVFFLSEESDSVSTLRIFLELAQNLGTKYQDFFKNGDVETEDSKFAVFDDGKTTIYLGYEEKDYEGSSVGLVYGSDALQEQKEKDEYNQL